MDLQAIVDYAQIVSTATVLGGTIFGLIQLKEFRKQRRDAVAGDLMKTFMSAEFVNAAAIILRFPDGISTADLRRAGPDAERAAVLVETTFETMGLLVFERITPFPLVLDLAGGTVVLMWRKLHVWLAELRVELANPADGEWFQWLAEQCEHRKAGKMPAHLQHRDWQP